MSHETRRVLDLLAQGKITVEEADQLLRALGTPAPDPAATPPGGEPPRPRYLRIVVHKAANDRGPEKDVSVRVPLSIVRSGMRLGAIIPGFAGKRVADRLRERGLGLDFSQLDYTELEAMLKEMGEVNIDVDDGRAQVRVTCE